METTGEMNWQLLIKMVSSSLGPLPFDSLFGSWKIDWEPEELAARVLAVRGLQASEGRGCDGGEGALGRRAAGTRLAFFLFMPTIHHR